MGWRRHKNRRIKKADVLNDTLLTVLYIPVPVATLWTLYHLNVLFPNSKPQTSLSSLSQLPFQLTSIIPVLNSMWISSVPFLSLPFSWPVISFLLSPQLPLCPVSQCLLSRIQTWINPAICYRRGRWRKNMGAADLVICLEAVIRWF